MKENNPGASVFVKINDYKEIVNVIDMLKSKLKEARSTLSRIESLKAQEEEQLGQWNSTIDEVEAKISSIDKSLFEPEQ